jgi:hypothetical protein
MSNNIVTTSDSPFDSIRRFDQDGNEFWIARELMGVMGYVKWERFENPISQAIENLELNQDKVSDHFFPLEGSYKGQIKRDFKLTRYASYMTALCCDGRKPEVAAAKKYFALKTRQAETVIPKLESDNETLRLMLLLERERNKGKELDNTMLTIHGDRVVLALRGQSDLIIEKETLVTEVIDNRTGKTSKFLSAEQLKRAVNDRTGQKLKAASHFVEMLQKKGRDDLLIPVERPNTALYVKSDKLNEAIDAVYGNVRQKLIGE